MKTITVNASQAYKIFIDLELLNTSLVKNYCENLANRFAIITDSNIVNSLGRKIYQHLKLQGLNVELFAFPAGEKNKNRQTKEFLEDQLLAKHYGRDSCLIAIGGGVVLDLAGFVAATYCRGIPVIYIPTTLLAMVDASIGGKTGLNTQFGKNLIGSFTQPHAVFIDVSTLNSLPINEFNNGLVEIIKHALISDADLFKYLYENKKKLASVKKLEQHDEKFLINLIFTSCLIKKNIVEQDENEQGIRKLLNFGHTIGHAVECIENYKISHGKAVAIGILVESYLSLKNNYLQEKCFKNINEIFKIYQIPLKTSAFINTKNFYEVLLSDKKSINLTPHFALLDEIGKPHIENNCYTHSLNLTDLNKALNWAAKNFSGNVY